MQCSLYEMKGTRVSRRKTGPRVRNTRPSRQNTSKNVRNITEGSNNHRVISATWFDVRMRHSFQVLTNGHSDSKALGILKLCKVVSLVFKHSTQERVDGACQVFPVSSL